MTRRGSAATFAASGYVLALALALAAAPAHATTDDLAAYVRARVADADGAVGPAVADYAVALDAAPANVAVALRAYREAVQAGDFALADRAAAALAKADALPADAALLAVAGAARAHDRAAAAAVIAQLDKGPLRILSAPLRAWGALEFGGDPLAELASRPADAVARRFAEEARALILLARGDTADGLAALRPLLGNDQASEDNRIAAARLLIAQGKVAEAQGLLTGATPAIVALRARPASAARAGLAFGAAALFTRVASDLALGPPGPLGYALVQGALRADPAGDRARLLLAGLLSKDHALDRAVAVLDGVARDGIYAAQAATGRVQILAAAGRDAAALAAARRLGEQADDGDVQRLADLYMRLDRAADAAPLYARLAARAGADWSDWLQYGAALDRAGQWRAARPALEKAVALGPDEPLALNYLGYSLIEHRVAMAEAQRLLERAQRLKPDDAAIADSLGWALFLRGKDARALPLIERAAAADPTNPEIAEHLGDVYWRAGRRYEARYAWAAARVVAPTPREAARLAGKISDGL